MNRRRFLGVLLAAPVVLPDVVKGIGIKNLSDEQLFFSLLKGDLDAAIVLDVIQQRWECQGFAGYLPTTHGECESLDGICDV